MKFHHYVALLHGGHVDRLHVSGIWPDHKPILWFTKPDGNKDLPTKYFDLRNVVQSNPPLKDTLEWEQSTEETEYMIDPLTVKGDVICDPFMGTGTTGVAALKQKRKFIGYEIDPETYSKAVRRLSSIKFD